MTTTALAHAVPDAGSRLRDLRRARGFASAAEAGRAAGVHPALWWGMEAGVRAVVDHRRGGGEPWTPCARAVAALLRVEPADVWPDTAAAEEAAHEEARRTAEGLAAAREDPPTPEDLAGRAELVVAVRDALTTLPPRSAEILVARFGLDGAEPVTLEALGLRWGVTRERVRQLEAQATRRLRSQLQPHAGGR